MAVHCINKNMCGKKLFFSPESSLFGVVKFSQVIKIKPAINRQILLSQRHFDVVEC